ncbi:MAG TPA: dipeptidase PepE [Gammaproteobacteria bacterium]|nr:dipeptidase PepE [Gammaproteobacteria bacterium]
MPRRTRLLLLSSSRTPGTDFLEHARGHIRDFLGRDVKRVTLVPYAAVAWSYAALTERVLPVFRDLGYGCTSLHDSRDPRAALAAAEALVVAGGNTFRLLQQLQALKLLGPLRERVQSGVPYLGWSAGSNLACPTIRTTNDMPAAWPDGGDALGLVPFQINPHYTERSLPEHHGETRDDRLREFMILNPGVTVVGLREGSALRVEDGRLALLGDLNARVFREGEARELAPGESAQFLLERPSRP